MSMHRLHWVRFGGGFWILCGALHMIGRLLRAGPETAEGAMLLDMMMSVRVEAGPGVTRTVFEVTDGVSLGFALLLFMTGFLVLLLGRPGLLPDNTMRRVAGMNALAAAALLIVAVRQLPVSTAVATGLATAAFVAAAIRRGPSGPGPAVSTAPDRVDGPGP